MIEIAGANLQWQNDSGEWVDIGPIDIFTPKTSEVWRKRKKPFSVTLVYDMTFRVWDPASGQTAIGEVDAGQ